MTTTIDARPRIRPSRSLRTVVRMVSQLRLVEEEVKGLRSVVRAGDQVFDVGAGYGMYTFPLAHLVGAGGSVHSFEPQPAQRRVVSLLRRIFNATQVTVVQAALGARRGQYTLLLPVRFGLPIHGHAHIGDGHLIPAARTLRTGSRSRRTPMRTVDDWCELKGLRNVSFIKVDVEGFEPNVLAGASVTIDRSSPSLLLEIEDRHTSRYGRDANHFADEVRSRWPQYGMYSLSGHAWKAADRIRPEVRNYLFATDAAFERP